MCPSLIEIGSKTAEKNSAQTFKQTNRQTDRPYENNGHLAVNQYCCSQHHHHHQDWLTEWVKVLQPTQHKIGHFRDVPQANLLAWYGKTKPNTARAHIYESKAMYYNTKKTKARFSCLLRHLAWKQSGPILVSALHKFVTYLNTSLTGTTIIKIEPS